MPEPCTSLELGVIGNCQVAALVDVNARIVWFCLPRPDGDPVFSALLTPRDAGQTPACGPEAQTGPAYPLQDSTLELAHPSGVFAIDLCEPAQASHEYVRNTAVLTTTLCDAHGNMLRVTDFCPRFRSRGRMFRPTTLVRIVEPLAGRPVARIRIDPTCDYGATRPQVRSGSHHITYASDSLHWRVTTDASLSSILEPRPEVIERPIAFLLGPEESVAEAPMSLARHWLEETTDYWRDWVRALAIPFEWQDAVIRAAITLKLCTFEDTGAVLAALTTSIPEAPDSGRNWDYRYCWLRDAYFVVQALNRLGTTRTMEHLLHFLDHTVARTDEIALQPLYGVGGGARLPERVVDSLPGYRGMGPVRIGNQAYRQVQHDSYGSAVLAATHVFFDKRLTRRGDEALFRRLEPLGELAVANHDQPDAGLWELRGSARVHTYSAVMCWAACDRLARIADHLGLAERAAYWRRHARHIHATISTRAWSERRGAFVATFEGDTMDASLLLLAELDFLAADDPRFAATVEAVAGDLKRGDFIFRYVEKDDFGEPENAFLVCTFWYINALAAIGRKDEARTLFETMLAARNRHGLLAEHVDTRSGESWGNFVQTYSMVGLINSAIRLSLRWDQAF